MESVLSALIFGLMLVAALSVVGASKSAELKNDQQQTALMLAQDLIAEILRQAYEDSNQVPVDDPETGEAGSNRLLFDDIDD